MSSGLSWQNHPPEKLLAECFHISTGFHPRQHDIIEQLVQGKPSAIVSSDFSEDENKATLEQAVAGSFKLLFIAPERLDNLNWQTYVPRMRISMIVIDEAHCISTWGHDFRPHYRRIVRLLTALPDNTPVLALTATANKRVEEDILQQIGEVARVIRGTMQRPNLYLNVVQLSGEREKLSYLGEVLIQRQDTGIIYTATRSSAEMVATYLQHQGVKAEYYHADREDDIRQDIEQKLMSNQYKVVCSTSALGMGIDKPDVRFVVHYHIPASLIHYYQEMGRAGRDGKIAWCILLYDPEDLAIQEYFIDNAKPDGKSYDTVLSLLHVKPHDLYDLMQETGFSKKAIQIILADLDDQHLIEYNRITHIYNAVALAGRINFSPYETVRLQKKHELKHMRDYIYTDGCYMEYLTDYLGDQLDYHCGACGNCLDANFPLVKPSQTIQGATDRFLEEEFLPPIEKRNIEDRLIHEAGWSLAYYSISRIGKLVRASKYEDAGPFPLGIVYRSIEVLSSRYPIHTINGIVSVPPTKSGMLVEMFARQVASMLGLEYLPAIAKVRLTYEQKDLTNRVQKFRNVKGTFCVRSPGQIVGRTLLLIDDVYDSGHMLREVSQTLMQAGARAVYPFTITRTTHSDDQ